MNVLINNAILELRIYHFNFLRPRKLPEWLPKYRIIMINDVQELNIYQRHHSSNENFHAYKVYTVIEWNFEIITFNDFCGSGSQNNKFYWNFHLTFITLLYSIDVFKYMKQNEYYVSRCKILFTPRRILFVKLFAFSCEICGIGILRSVLRNRRYSFRTLLLDGR